jgi:hypothetical protein
MYTADDVADRLATAGVGTVATNIFTGRLPQRPDTAAYIRQVGGARAARGFGNVPAVAEFPDVQVVVRGATYTARTTMADAVKTALDFKTWTGTSGAKYFSQLQYEPVDLGEDENQRPQISLVIRLVRQ